MLSVVIAAQDAVREIGPCLESLEPQRTPEIEVIVVDASTDGTAALVGRRYPWVRLVVGAQGSGVSELRAAGLAESRGAFVAFTDPNCRVAPDWLATWTDQPWDRYAAVGGVVDAAPRQTLADWAAFLNEYALHLPPQRRGEARVLPGNNVAFRRDALLRAGLMCKRQFWKTFALWRLAECGERFWVDPQLVVRHARNTTAAKFTRHRYLHGRCFAANRATGEPQSWRMARAAICPVLPLLFTLRLVRAVQPSRRYRGVLWQSLPINLLYHAAWAIGELDGYMRGSGDACERLR